MIIAFNYSYDLTAYLAFRGKTSSDDFIIFRHISSYHIIYTV